MDKSTTLTKKQSRITSTLSRIALGTVEIGYTYGIGPRCLPEENQAIALLKRAVELGIKFFDTAHFYGLAEARIAASGIAKQPGVIIATKCGHDIEKNKDITAAEIAKAINAEVDASRKALDLDILPIAMIHGGSAEQIKNGMIIEIMQKLKDEGKILFTGISTRGEEAPEAAIASNFFDYLQIGYSIFDQRQNKKNLAFAKQKQINIIARSVLLKGALTPAYIYLPEELAELKQGYKKLSMIAQDINSDVATLCLRFAFSNKNIDTVLIGTQNISHLEKAIAALEQGSLPVTVIKQLEKIGIDDPHYVDPSYWPKATHSDEKSKIVRHFEADKK